jgi:membrane protein implicated in regulation of membrane protease activity
MIDVFAWYNAIFLISISVGLLMIIGSALGAFGHGDVGHDLGHDVSHDAGHDTGHDQDARGRANALDLNADAAHGIFSWTLSFLGVGRVPFSIILMMLALIFGGTGMSVNYLIMPIIAKSSVFAILSLGIALVATFFLTGALARLVNRLMPSTESYNVSKDSLVGRTGEVVIEASSDNGFADVHDRYHGIQRIECRSLNEVLPIGTEIVVIELREEDKIFIVEPFRG